MDWNLVVLSILVAIASWILTKNNFGPFRSHENDCNMTYMWRQMQYMPTGFKYGDRYNLILYGEGFYALNFFNTRKVDGIPVLFVPGNAGSARQVRSLGSVLQNKTEMLNTKFHFDVFGVDFNEELSGLSSEYILSQADYLSEAVDYIWSMYENPPRGIILVGHSMGGIAIRLLISDPEFDLKKVGTVLTFATPHKRAPLSIDHKLLQIYDKIHAAWDTHRIKNSHVKFASVSGGFKDELIDEKWTKDENVTHVSTTGLDRVWVEADHQCIVWCNQLVRQTSRILFEYAKNPKNFIQKPEIYFNRYYKESGLRLKKVLPKNGTQILSLDSCTLKCPSDSFLQFNVDEMTSSKSLLVLTTLTHEPENLIQVMDQNVAPSTCRPMTRFMTHTTLYSFLRLSNCVGQILRVSLANKQAWVIDDADLHLSYHKSMTLYVPALAEIVNFFTPIAKLSLRVDQGVKTINVSLSNNDLVLRLDFKKTCELGKEGIHRAVWTSFSNASSVRRLDEMRHGKNQLFLYFMEESNYLKDVESLFGHVEEYKGQIMFISSENCTYEVELNIDYPKTVYRFIRDFFEFLVIFLLIHTTLYTITPMISYEWYLNLPWAHYFVWVKFLWKTPILLFTLASVVFIVWHIALAMICVIRNVVSVIEKRLPSNSLFLKVGFMLLLANFLNYVHSFPVAIVVGVMNILILQKHSNNFPSITKGLSLLLVFLILLQVPAGVVYFSNVIKYHELVSTSTDLNKFSNIVLFFVSLTRFFNVKKYLVHPFMILICIFYFYEFFMHFTLEYSSIMDFSAFNMLVKVFMGIWVVLYYLFVVIFE